MKTMRTNWSYEQTLFSLYSSAEADGSKRRYILSKIVFKEYAGLRNYLLRPNESRSYVKRIIREVLKLAIKYNATSEILKLSALLTIKPLQGDCYDKRIQND